MKVLASSRNLQMRTMVVYVKEWKLVECRKAKWLSAQSGLRVRRQGPTTGELQTKHEIRWWAMTRSPLASREYIMRNMTLRWAD